jgi:hypothetical protein
MRTLLLVTFCCAGCARSVKDESAHEDAWHAGLTDEQVAAVQADKVACSEMYDKLRDAAGDPAPGSVEYLGLIRLNAHHDEYLREVRAGNLRTAAPYFRQLVEGKTLTDLAWEQSAELPNVGR